LLPFADLLIFETFRSSIHTSAWFLLIAVEVLWRKSRRTFAIMLCSFWTFAFALPQFLLNFWQLNGVEDALDR